MKSLVHCFRSVYADTKPQLSVETITGEQILARKLFEPLSSTEHELDMSVRLLCIGGGFDLGYVKTLGLEGMRIIREFVQTGGNYLGICAGAYFATDYVQFDAGGPLEVTGS